MTTKRTYRYTFVIMTVLVLMAAYIQYTIGESTKNLQSREIDKAKHYAAKIVTYIQDNACAPLSSCLDNSLTKRATLNKMLNAFQSSDFTNLFVLYRDPKNNFRFLLDSDLNDPAEYKSVFFPESGTFDKIYASGEPRLITQSGDVKKVWLSLLYPIREQNSTEALLVLDLSESYGKSLQDFNSPLQHVTLLLQLFTLFSIFFLAYVIYDSYRLRKSVLIDSLTGAYTKLYRKEYFEERRVNAYDFILIDIDRFSHINEKFGRNLADALLAAFVAYLKQITPRGTKVVRNHGAEFLLLLKKEHEALGTFTHKLFDLLSKKRYQIGEHSITFTLSVCAAKTPHEAKSFYEIESILDKKLLDIKNLGKNSVAILDNISDVDIKYNDIDFIKQAIDNDRITCLFQPIYHAKTNKIYKYEALVRLIDDDHKILISPFYFMDFIRESIHYIRLSKWVIQHIFQILRENPEEKISINLDLADLYNEEMMNIIQQEIYENRELANRLTFEILEHQEIKEFDRIGMIFRQLKQFGSSIAIDDFGSGYANFGYMAKLDIDILKIDGALIQALENDDSKMQAVIKLINDLGRSQHVKIVAEHVSSKKIHDILLGLDVEYLQGFYLGKPEPWEVYHPSA